MPGELFCYQQFQFKVYQFSEECSPQKFESLFAANQFENG